MKFLIVPVVAISLLFSALIYFTSDSEKRIREVVNDFWEQALKGQTKEARQLTTDFSDSSVDSSQKIEVVSGGSQGRGSILMTLDCCITKEINERQLKLNEIRELTSKNDKGGLIVEASDKDGKTETVLICMKYRKPRNDWSINRIEILESAEDKTKPIADLIENNCVKHPFWTGRE
jgi:hypothetical protein